MIIQCTKKLLDEMYIKPQSPVDENSIFSWHANLLTIKRKKVVVLVNDCSRYAITLYGLKAKDFNRFNEIIVQAIKEMLEAEQIRPEIVDNCIESCREITYTKTKDRTSVARMNKVCEDVCWFEDMIEADKMNQINLNLHVATRLYGTDGGNYDYSRDMFYKALEEHFQMKIFCMQAFELKVTLLLESHKVYRTLIVPSRTTFEDLQKAFNVLLAGKIITYTTLTY